jgi:hypothetical protein
VVDFPRGRVRRKGFFRRTGRYALVVARHVIWFSRLCTWGHCGHAIDDSSGGLRGATAGTIASSESVMLPKNCASAQAAGRATWCLTLVERGRPNNTGVTTQNTVDRHPSRIEGTPLNALHSTKAHDWHCHKQKDEAKCVTLEELASRCVRMRP